MGRRIFVMLFLLLNRYQGEKRRVFVVATGPSLTMEDLNKLELNNEISISMNGIFRVFQNTTWRPTYYILGDPGAFEKLEFRQCHFEECAKREVLLSNLCRKKLCYATNREKIGFFNYNILDHGVARYGSKWYKYSNEFDSGIYDFYTVTNCAIMLADYLGIRDIYLLGVDCNYTGPKAHVGQEEHNITEDELKNALFNQNNMIQSYKKINEILKNKKIRIYNSTRGGSLEVFPRVNFDDLF